MMVLFRRLKLVSSQSFRVYYFLHGLSRIRILFTAIFLAVCSFSADVFVPAVKIDWLLYSVGLFLVWLTFYTLIVWIKAISKAAGIERYDQSIYFSSSLDSQRSTQRSSRPVLSSTLLEL